jgi:hypothetical protein
VSLHALTLVIQIQATYTHSTMCQAGVVWTPHVLVAANWCVVVAGHSCRDCLVLNVDVDLPLPTTHNAAVARACSRACIASTKASQLCSVAVQGVCRQKYVEQWQPSTLGQCVAALWQSQTPHKYWPCTFSTSKCSLQGLLQPLQANVTSAATGWGTQRDRNPQMLQD